MNKIRYTAQVVPSVHTFPLRRNKVEHTDSKTSGRTDGHDILQRCDGTSKNRDKLTKISWVSSIVSRL